MKENTDFCIFMHIYTNIMHEMELFVHFYSADYYCAENLFVVK